jgi:hypothetical protein
MYAFIKLLTKRNLIEQGQHEEHNLTEYILHNSPRLQIPVLVTCFFPIHLVLHDLLLVPTQQTN